MPKRRRWGPPPPQPCWCCRRTGVRPAIAAEVEHRRVAYVCQVCAADEPLVRAFVARQLAAQAGKELIFRRLPFIRRTVFEVVFADYPRTAAAGGVAVAVPAPPDPGTQPSRAGRVEGEKAPTT